MNCKPGDMAVIVRRTTDHTPRENLGAIVTVVKASLVEGMWFVESARPLKNAFGGGRKGLCYDADLQPIRPPGEPVDVRKEDEVPA